MDPNVLCLRPEADFSRVDAPAPATLQVTYRGPDDPAMPQLMREASALLIPAVGPKLAPALFAESRLKLVQVTGAGVRPARARRARAARHPGGQRRGRQQRRRRRICGDGRVAAPPALRLGRCGDQSRQLCAVPRPHGGGQPRRARGQAGRAHRLRRHRARGRAGFPSHGLPDSATTIRPRARPKPARRSAHRR